MTAQAARPAQMGVDHGQQLVPAAELLVMLVGLVLAYHSIKHSTRQALHDNLHGRLRLHDDLHGRLGLHDDLHERGARCQARRWRTQAA